MMNRKNERMNKLIRAYMGFDQEIKDTIDQRIKIGKDSGRKPQTSTRITAAIVRHNYWKRIKEDMIKADLPPLREDKKGAVGNLLASGAGLIIFIIVAFILVLIAAFWVYGFNQITNSLTTLPNQNNVTNVSYYAQVTFGNINSGFQQLRWISFVIIFGMLIGIFVSNFLVKVHPAFFGLYLLICALAVVISIFVANSYETLYNSGGVVGSSLQSFTASSYVLLYLPVWVTVISLIGGIFLFVGITRDPEQGGFF